MTVIMRLMPFQGLCSPQWKAIVLAIGPPTHQRVKKKKLYLKILQNPNPYLEKVHKPKALFRFPRNLSKSAFFTFAPQACSWPPP